MQSRAYRRHQRDRMIAKQLNKYKHIYSGFSDEEAMRFARCSADLRQPCSCVMCGNPRKWFGERTRQEQLAQFDAQLQLEEVGLS